MKPDQTSRLLSQWTDQFNTNRSLVCDPCDNFGCSAVKSIHGGASVSAVLLLRSSKSRRTSFVATLQME